MLSVLRIFVGKSITYLLEIEKDDISKRWTGEHKKGDRPTVKRKFPKCNKHKLWVDKSVKGGIVNVDIPSNTLYYIE